MFAACCCSEQSQGEVVSVEPSSSAPAGLVTDNDDENAPSARVAEHESELDLPLLPVAQAEEKTAPSSDAVPEFIEFEATFDKSGGEKLGLDISAYDGKTLLVGKVKPGPVMRWNEQNAQQLENCIFRGDKIVVINGIRDDSDELLGAARAEVLNVTMRRRIEVRVVIAYGANDLFGLTFEDAPDGRVVISRVDEGSAQEANRIIPADMEIRPGDQVLQLNGANAEGAESVRTAVAACSSSGQAGTLSLRLRRGMVI